MIDRAKEFDGDRLMFVPTHYWLSDKRDGHVDGYCYVTGDDGALGGGAGGLGLHCRYQKWFLINVAPVVMLELVQCRF